MLNLRNLVKNIPRLRKALDGSQSQLLQIVHEVWAFVLQGKAVADYCDQMISDERLSKIEQLVCANLNEETITAKVRPLHQGKKGIS